MGECESRLMCGAAMQQERVWMHNHFTTMLPEDKRPATRPPCSRRRRLSGRRALGSRRPSRHLQR
eukprot:7241812-Prymnesium_polylepis.1